MIVISRKIAEKTANRDHIGMHLALEADTQVSLSIAAT